MKLYVNEDKTNLCLDAPCGTYATDYLSPSSSVLCCCLHLPPAVPEICCSHFCLLISFFQVFCGRPVFLWWYSVHCSICLAVKKRTVEKSKYFTVLITFVFWNKLKMKLTRKIFVLTGVPYFDCYTICQASAASVTVAKTYIHISRFDCIYYLYVLCYHGVATDTLVD